MTKNEENPFLISSTECFEGSCIMIVTSVGKNSIFGRMNTQIESQGEEHTPLENKLTNLTKFLSIIGAFACCLTFVCMTIVYLVKYI